MVEVVPTSPASLDGVESPVTSSPVARTTAADLHSDSTPPNPAAPPAAHPHPDPTTPHPAAEYPQHPSHRSTTAAPVPSPANKGGRRAKFTAKDDLIIAREVSAAKAHVAQYGEIQKKFSIAADKANVSKELSIKVTAKSIQDRYEKIQDTFDRKDSADRRLSGVGGEIGELDELLGMMAEARNEIEKEKHAEIAAAEAKEDKKARIGNDLMTRVLARKGSTGGSGGISGSGEDGDENDSSDEKGLRKKRKTYRRRLGDDMDGELAVLGTAMKEADMARVEIERQRLGLERDRFDSEKIDREKERELRREEREARDKIEMDKFKLMLETASQLLAKK